MLLVAPVVSLTIESLIRWDTAWISAWVSAWKLQQRIPLVPAEKALGLGFLDDFFSAPAEACRSGRKSGADPGAVING